jgi:hypothetical protein
MREGRQYRAGKEGGMYGTVAQVRLKPGSEAAFIEQLRAYTETCVAGLVAQTVYRLDKGGDEYLVAVTFASRDAYVANSENPAQHQQYVRLREFMDADPLWHDGVVVRHFTADAGEAE